MKRNITTLLTLFFLSLSLLTYGQGSRYTGGYTKTSPISYSNRSNIVIEGVEISNNNGYAIALYNSENITIKNSKFGPTPMKTAIYLFNCKNITIIDNTFENVQSGLIASTSSGIKFDYNDVTNVVGQIKGGDRIGVLAQFIQVSGAGNSISYNVNENFAGQSSPEDLININQSNGTAQSPIVVRGNWIRGGGPSVSGGGINLGDLGGSYQIAEDNILVNPGQYGVAISGGHSMTLKNNKVYAKRDHFNNVGMIAVNWYEGQSHSITVSGNSINYTNKDGVQNSWWFAGNVEPIAGKSTNKTDMSITASILPSQIIGRAKSGSTGSGGGTGTGSDNGNGNGSGSSNPDNTPDPNENSGSDNSSNTDPDPTPGTDNNGNEQTEDQNHPSILIYKDRFNRLCVINRGSVARNAYVLVGMSGRTETYTQRLNGFHTAINYVVPSGWTLDVFVKNGDKTSRKQLTF